MSVDAIVRRRAAGALPPAVEAYQPSGPAEDGDEELTDHVGETQAELIGERVWLAYTDAGGAESERIVVLRRVIRRQQLFYLRGICELRRGWRSFRADRVRQIVRIGSTGEVIDRVDLWLAGLKDPDPVGSLLDAYKAHATILLYVAQCDQSFDDEEVEHIAEYLWDCANYAADVSREALCDALRSMWPDETAFRSAVRSLRSSDVAGRRKFQAYLRRVVDADQILAPEEVESALRISDVLGKGQPL